MTLTKAHPFDALLQGPGGARSPYSRDSELQRRYYWLAARLKKARGLEPKDQEYLVAVFTALAGGMDSKKIFGGKAKRGEKRVDSYLTHRRREAMKAYIALLILPELEGGFGMSLNEAFLQASKEFGFTPSTVKSYWYKSDKDLHFII